MEQLDERDMPAWVRLCHHWYDGKIDVGTFVVRSITYHGWVFKDLAEYVREQGEPCELWATTLH